MFSIPHWSTLNRVQNIKIIKSTYIWLLIVPLLSKFLSKIDNTLKIDISGKSYVFDMELPFSWKILFFTALLFTLANMIYVFLSPKIIKEQSDLGDFLSQGKGMSQLLDYMNNKEQNKFSESILIEKHEKKLIKIWFWETYNQRNSCNIVARSIIFVLYVFGFLSISYILLSNIQWVILQL